MIKFFRKIRYNLMSENKTGKYLKYAIGEIVLVMIGILLALQVNNWNEQRKFNSLKKVYVERLINDLQQDSTEVSELLVGLNEKQRIIETVIKEIDGDSTSEQLISSLENYFSAGWNMLDFTPSASTYSDLTQTGNMNVFRNPELIERIKQYYVKIENETKGQNINKDWIIPLDVALSQESSAFEFDPNTRQLFNVENRPKALQNLLMHKDLLKRNAAGHYWFNASLERAIQSYKEMGEDLINSLQKE